MIQTSVGGEPASGGCRTKRSEFDGDPSIETEQEIDETGAPMDAETVIQPEPEQYDILADQGPLESRDPGGPERRKFYFDGGQVAIASHLVYELDPDGKQLRVMHFTDYTAEKVRSLFRNAAVLRGEWADPAHRRDIVERLAERGIDFDDLAKAAQRPEADPLDLMCHLAFNAPLRTRRERAQRLRREEREFLGRFGPEARQILDELLDKYTEHGTAQFLLPDVLELPPISSHGSVLDIARCFGDEDHLVEAVNRLQTLLYAA